VDAPRRSVIRLTASSTSGGRATSRRWMPLEDQGLRRNPVFPRLLQALVELARKDNQNDERAPLELIMNHLGARECIDRCG